ncbi:hypothetical protein CPB84DRAFT_1779209 [Gymnopilus junonius]|uniref:Uncharacterized protein n=1 Tax=Gymnopilus junonius TaxID=109634 RepID=A0A9P5TM34_GYMJU|nr:hypothetical protein CPB84DRAFT_1779209 [Gymnopilus junonius]
MEPNSWAPANETASEIWNERSILDGLFVGAGFTLPCLSQPHVLLVGKRTKQDYLFLAYISLLFILGNIGNGMNIKFGKLTFIDNRNYPGGPNAFFVEQSINPIAVICNCMFIVNSWLQDALLLYHLWIISQRTWYIMAVPSLLFLASVVFSLFLIIELSQPNITLWSKISVNLAIPYCYAMNSPIQNLALPALGQTQSIAPFKTPMKFVYSTKPSDRFMGEDTLTMPRGMGSSTVFATIENKSISDSPSVKDINDDTF